MSHSVAAEAFFTNNNKEYTYGMVGSSSYQSSHKKAFTCFTCGKQGHMARTVGPNK